MSLTKFLLGSQKMRTSLQSYIHIPSPASCVFGGSGEVQNQVEMTTPLRPYHVKCDISKSVRAVLMLESR